MNTEQSEICPLRLAMDVVGGKWRLSIICLLKDGKPLRYNQIKRGVPGITNVMLSQSLKHLEEYGIVSRRKYNEVPVRVEYQLTNNGKTLLDLLEQFSEWETNTLVDTRNIAPTVQTVFFGMEKTFDRPVNASWMYIERQRRTTSLRFFLTDNPWVCIIVLWLATAN